jgi:RNA polymerase sigma-70 factor, ECF subfamily
MTLQDIYREHFRFVWRALHRLGVPEQDLADAVQDVFLVVHRKLTEFRGDSKLTTWLFGICARVASDRRRLAHVRREVPGASTDQQADESGDLVNVLERRDARAMLERILDEMPTEQRVVFGLFELDGMLCEEIATLLDIPVGTVYSRLRLARQVFQKSVARRLARDRFRLGEAREERL